MYKLPEELRVREEEQVTSKFKLTENDVTVIVSRMFPTLSWITCCDIVKLNWNQFNWDNRTFGNFLKYLMDKSDTLSSKSDKTDEKIPTKYRVDNHMTWEEIESFFIRNFPLTHKQRLANFKKFMVGQTCGVRKDGKSLFYCQDINRFLAGLPVED